MTCSELEKFTGSDSLSVVEAMRKIDKNAKGILILTDGAGRLAGSLTDGDIRRFLLAGGKLEWQRDVRDCKGQRALPHRGAIRLAHQMPDGLVRRTAQLQCYDP